MHQITIENNKIKIGADDSFLLEKRLKDTDPDLHKRVTESGFVLWEMLWSFLDRFPGYTDHSTLHSLNVVNYCNQLIGKDQVENLYPLECYALIMACHLHDIGMGISDRDLRGYLEMTGNDIDLDSLPEEEMMDLVRSQHHELSGYLIKKYDSLFDFPSEEVEHAVIQISRGHRKTDLYDTEEYPDMVVDGSLIRTSYLSAVLRIADELDIANDRNPDFLFDTSTLTRPDDIMYFGIHESIRLVEIADSEIRLHNKPKSDEYIHLVRWIADIIQKKLDYCRDVTEKRSDFHIRPDKVVLVDIK